MVNRARRTRLLALPGNAVLAGGRLDGLRSASHDLLMDFQELQLSATPDLFEQDGRLWERVQGFFLPHRLRFTNALVIKGAKLGVALEALSEDDPARALTSAWQWRTPESQNFYLFGVRFNAQSSLLLSAQRCRAMKRSGPKQEVSLERDWSPPPPSHARLVPHPSRIHQRFGGDPIEIVLDGRIQPRRLFIGGVDIQPQQRPDVHAVLNLGEQPSRWAVQAPLHPADRCENKGEGQEGMSVQEISAEARWVIECLHDGQRVLVHCTAGMNRSATVCCATLILLEGLSAEAALERVRRHHPWARPDSHHWLALRWLAHTLRGPDIDSR